MTDLPTAHSRLPGYALLTIPQAAAYLNADVRPALLRRAARAGTLACVRLGRKVYVTPDDLSAWVESCRVRKSPRASGSPPPSATPTAASPAAPAGSSSTADASTALARAHMTIERLKRL